MSSRKDFFSLNADEIWDGNDYSWRLSNPSFNPTPVDKRCLNALWRFLEYKGEVKFISDFRKLLGYENPEFLRLKDNPLRTPLQKMILPGRYGLKTEIRDMNMKGIWFGFGISYNKTPSGLNEPFGILISQAIGPVYNLSEERQYFKTLFPFRYIQLPSDYKREFLQFHFNETFQGDWKIYRRFLIDVREDSKDVLFDFLDSYNDWISENLTDTPKSMVAEDQFSSFQNAIISETHYRHLIDLLSKPEHGKYFDAKGNWVRKKSGKVESAITLLDTLKNRGYFKPELTWSNETKRTLIQKWFGFSVGANSSKLDSTPSKNLITELSVIKQAREIIKN